MTITDRGANSNGVAGTTAVISPSGTMAVGSTGIIILAMDNATASATNLAGFNFTDSVGNYWIVKTIGFGATANTTQDLSLWTCTPLTNAMTSSDTLTINLNASTTAKTWSVIEAIPATSDNIVMWVDGACGISSATASPTISTFEIAVGSLLLGSGAAECADLWTGDSDTLNGSWSTAQKTGVGSGTTGMSVITQWKITTTDPTLQTYNPTLSGSNDVRVMWDTFIECDKKGRLVGPISQTSSATMVSNIEESLAIGSIGVLCISADNSAGTGATKNFPSSFSDSKSNTWTLRLDELWDPGAAAAGVEMAIYTSVLTSALVADDTITVTFSVANVVGKIAAIWEFAPQSAGTMSFLSSGFTTPGSSTSAPTVTTTSITSGDYVVGLSASESFGVYTGDSDTTNGSWKTMMHYGKTVGVGGISICTQWKLTTGTATQTYNPTIGTALDTMIGWISLRETVSAGGATGNFFLAL